MGNQLCAPWRKGYAEDERQWTPRKDSHLLRLVPPVHLVTCCSILVRMKHNNDRQEI